MTRLSMSERETTVSRRTMQDLKQQWRLIIYHNHMDVQKLDCRYELMKHKHTHTTYTHTQIHTHIHIHTYRHVKQEQEHRIPV